MRPGVVVTALGARLFVLHAARATGGRHGIRVTFSAGGRSHDAAYDVVLRASGTDAWANAPRSGPGEIAWYDRVLARLGTRLGSSRPTRSSRLSAVEWTVSEMDWL